MAEGDSGYGGGAEGLGPPPIGLGAIVRPHKEVPGLSSISARDLDKFLADDPAPEPEPAPEKGWLISVYIDDGLVFDYEVTSMASAREHAAAIQTSGYRSVSEDTPNVATFFPVHRIRKVKVTGPSSMPTAYTDKARGT